MAVPIVAAAVTAVRAFATRYGVKKAVEKFGDEAVQQASDNLSGVTAGDAATRKSPDRKPPEERPSKSTGEVDRMRKVGQRSAFKQAGEREAAKKPVEKSMGGKVKAYSSGGSVRGNGKARKTNSCTMVTMKGS